MPILLGLQVPPYEQKDDTNRINLKIRFIVEPRLDERLQLLVMINSMPDRFEERRRIRESWAMSELYDETTKVLFLIGKPNTVQIEEKLVVEEAGFHDVVVADIEEGYYSLSLKTYAMLYFKNTRIPAAKCLVKADSDNVLLIRNYERLCDETTRSYEMDGARVDFPEQELPKVLLVGHICALRARCTSTTPESIRGQLVSIFVKLQETPGGCVIHRNTRREGRHSTITRWRNVVHRRS